jgi:hypothetical protein
MGDEDQIAAKIEALENSLNAAIVEAVRAGLLCRVHVLDMTHHLDLPSLPTVRVIVERPFLTNEVIYDPVQDQLIAGAVRGFREDDDERTW